MCPVCTGSSAAGPGTSPPTASHQVSPRFPSSVRTRLALHWNACLGLRCGMDEVLFQVFVSHSSIDRDLATSLVELIRAALNISARDVRCSSADGYRLPVGVHVDDALKTELLGAVAFVCLLTPASVRSSYVLFELGARWGANRRISPVLAKGLVVSQLAGPLTAINALSLSERPQVLQLLEDLATALGRPFEPLGAFDSMVDNVATLARSAATLDAVPTRSDEQPSLSAEEMTILNMIAESSSNAEILARKLGVRGAKADFHVQRLVDAGLISINNKHSFHQASVRITQRGREKLIEMGLM